MNSSYCSSDCVDLISTMSEMGFLATQVRVAGPELHVPVSENQADSSLGMLRVRNVAKGNLSAKQWVLKLLAVFMSASVSSLVLLV